ncbi:Acg family FMN-binding oxidoreductase [Streptacidiphilus neutrinimicus]|uniref:Acg family FMN-binding oxidoreductase n=1 Tax=Streptacidiphilus neutrinimicus TaxID=105420 RepID=UPI0005A92474|nr:aromatic ring-opening dioxygenase LigA [Streptacidiphilus neutrinimicus]
MTPATLDAAVLEDLVSAAVAAPSMHNTQPWRFRLRPETHTVEIRAALDRELRAEDPDGRGLHLSVGAAVFNLRLAVAHHGWEPVLRLLPDRHEPQLLASVRLAGRRPSPAAAEPGLYEQIWRRHTSRSPFSPRPLPGPLWAELVDAARVEGALLHLPDLDETRRLLDLTYEAEARTITDEERRQESRRWIRSHGGTGLGIPPEALGPQDAAGRLPMRDFTALRPPTGQPARDFEQHPQLAVLATDHDHPADWLRAGLALQHVLLLATRDQVRASLLHQAVEWPDLRWMLRDPRSGPEHVQLLIRLGYGPEGAPTPRRTASSALG